MRIVEIVPQMHIGGAEMFVVNLCNELAARGHEVILIVTNSLKKYGHLVPFVDEKVRIIPMEKKAGPDPLLFLRLPRLVKKLKPDIVHTHLGAILYCIFSPYIYPKAKYFHTIHSQADKEAETGGWISAAARRFLFGRRRSTAVTISKESRRSFYDYYGPETPAELIFNGVPYKKPLPENAAAEMDKGKVKLVNVARIQAVKNQLALVKAVEQLNSSLAPEESVHLYIVGADDTPEADAIREFSPKHTSLLGRKNNPQDYLACSDAFVLTSVYEGLPLTLVECFAAGKIPICTPVGGIIDIVKDGENGVLTAGTTVNEIEEALRRFLGMTDEQKRAMELASHSSYQALSMEKCASDYIELFNR